MLTKFKEISELVTDLRNLGVIIKEDIIKYSCQPDIEKLHEHKIVIKRVIFENTSIYMKDINTMSAIFNSKFEKTEINYKLFTSYDKDEKTFVGFTFTCCIAEKIK